MIKFFLSATFATAFMCLVACKPTSTSSTAETRTKAATQTPITKTENPVPDTQTYEPTEVPMTKAESTRSVTETNAGGQTPATADSPGTVAGTTPVNENPYTTTEVNDTTGATEGSQPTTTASTGAVTDYIPGETLTLRTETGEPVNYKFGEIVTYVTPDGNVIDESKITKDSKLRVLYHKDGDDMVIDKVIVMGGHN